MTNRAVLAAYGKYVLANYPRVPIALVRGRGAWVWDAAGRRYLDMVPGIGAGFLGHCHPAVVRAVRAQAGRLLHVQNHFPHPGQAELARRLLRLARFDGRVFFCNSGAEAAEAAIKLARRWAQVERGTKRFEIVCVRDGFHGRTLGALAATGTPAFWKGFAPMPRGFRHIPLNDMRAAVSAIGPRTCAVLVEAVQGEGGFRAASPAWLRALRLLTRREGALLIFDEVQAGCGRTGTFFAYEPSGVAPDAVTLAKPLAGGLPVGALLVRARFARALPPGSHGATFGGSPLVCAAALAALDVLAAPRTLARIRRHGALLRRGLEALRARHPALVEEVRGRGLMAGLALRVPGAGVVERCRTAGLLVNCTHRTVIRLLPPVGAGPRELRRALVILDRALEGG